jgi:hypothetical protein
VYLDCPFRLSGLMHTKHTNQAMVIRRFQIITEQARLVFVFFCRQTPVRLAICEQHVYRYSTHQLNKHRQSATSRARCLFSAGCNEIKTCISYRQACMYGKNKWAADQEDFGPFGMANPVLCWEEQVLINFFINACITNHSCRVHLDSLNIILNTCCCVAAISKAI